MCAAESAKPTSVVTTVLHFEIAAAAGAGAVTSTARSQAGLPVVCAVGSVARIDSQCSSSKRKARVHGGGQRTSSKRRTSSSGDKVNPDPIPVQYFTPIVSDALQVWCSNCLTASHPSQLSESAV
jgi:hypothetical protein